MKNRNFIALLGFFSSFLLMVIALSNPRKPSIDRLRRAYAGIETEQE